MEATAWVDGAGEACGRAKGHGGGADGEWVAGPIGSDYDDDDY